MLKLVEKATDELLKMGATYNPRRITPAKLEALRASIRAFGFVEPVILNRKTGRIAHGHQRVQAAHLEGLTRLPVVELELTEADEKRLNLAMNNATGEFDPDKLGTLLASLKGEDLAPTGFAQKEIDRLLSSLKKADTTAVDEVPTAGKKVWTKRGDLIELGRHRLLCADSFNQEDRDALLAGKPADVVLTDPPFAIYGSASGISSSVADDKMVRPFFEQLGQACFAAVAVFSHVYVYCDWRSYATLWEGFKSAGLTPKNCLVWDKGNFGMGANWANAHEFVAFFAKLPPAKTMTSGQKAGQRKVNRGNILRYPRVTGDEREHNAAKPVALLSEILEASTVEGAMVLDLFGGSGSTMMAAEKTGRRACLMELEPGMCDVIVQRWQRVTGEKAKAWRGNR